MTEAEWLSCDNPIRPLWSLTGTISDRKLRLFACACCRRQWSLLTEPAQRVVEAVERFVDGLENSHRFAKVRREASRIKIRDFEPHLLAVRRANVETTHQAMISVTQLFYHAGGRRSSLDDGPPAEYSSELATAYHREWAALAVLFRDIFISPFRPVTFLPDWRTDTALTLARQMYASRDYSAMPILADALQDAGCDSEDLLNHCRDANATHVRGCWAVDLVLGKE